MSAGFSGCPIQPSYPLFCWVGIIEPDEKFSFVHLGKVLVQNRRFGVSNVEVAARLGREPCHDLTLLRALKSEGEGSSGLVRRSCFRFRLSKGTESILGGGKGVDVGKQSLQVRVLTAFRKTDRLEVG
jgi:hypothetical protein